MLYTRNILFHLLILPLFIIVLLNKCTVTGTAGVPSSFFPKQIAIVYAMSSKTM